MKGFLEYFILTVKINKDRQYKAAELDNIQFRGQN